MVLVVGDAESAALAIRTIYRRQQWVAFGSIRCRPKIGYKTATKWNNETGKLHLIENNDENAAERKGKLQNMYIVQYTFKKTSASRIQNVQPFSIHSLFLFD